MRGIMAVDGDDETLTTTRDMQYTFGRRETSTRGCVWRGEDGNWGQSRGQRGDRE